MKKITKKGQVYLYRKQENSIIVEVILLKNTKIATYWHDSSKTTNKYKQRLLELKINGCAICGYDKSVRALDFHHTNPKDKEFSINADTVKSATLNLANEINKCVLLCKNCHCEIEDLEEVKKDGKTEQETASE